MMLRLSSSPLGEKNWLLSERKTLQKRNAMVSTSESDAEFESDDRVFFFFFFALSSSPFSLTSPFFFNG